jgi:hypothetical protein
MLFLPLRSMGITIIERDTVLRWIMRKCIDWRRKGKTVDYGLALQERKGDTQVQRERDLFSPILLSDAPIQSQRIMAIMDTGTQIREIWCSTTSTTLLRQDIMPGGTASMVEEPQDQAALLVTKTSRIREFRMIRENVAHLRLPEALTEFNQEVGPGNNLRRLECLFPHHRLWNQFSDLREWSHHLKLSHREEEKASPEDMSDQFLYIKMSQEENPRETSTMRHEMMVGERDHTDTNVTKIQSTSEDLPYVLRDRSESSE